jgi:hypothetical protein
VRIIPDTPKPSKRSQNITTCDRGFGYDDRRWEIAFHAPVRNADDCPATNSLAQLSKPKQSAQDLRTRLASQGISLSDAEARAILQDLDLKSDPDARNKLQQLETISRQLGPILNRLQGLLSTSE